MGTQQNAEPLSLQKDEHLLSLYLAPQSDPELSQQPEQRGVHATRGTFNENEDTSAPSFQQGLRSSVPQLWDANRKGSSSFLPTRGASTRSTPFCRMLTCRPPPLGGPASPRPACWTHPLQGGSWF